MSKGVLYLIPTTLGDSGLSRVLPSDAINIVKTLDTFIVENAKSARQFLKLVGTDTPLQALAMSTLDEHTPANEIASLLTPLVDGKNVGLVSEAGCPAVADPGANLVKAAHESGIQVVPLVGPSSILLALMASGLNGQRFAFHGYLPVPEQERAEKIILLEKESTARGQTQIFIEAPYRNQKLLESLVNTCRRETALCIATDITLQSESIRTQTIAAWKKVLPDINKRPTIFLILGDSVRAKLAELNLKDEDIANAVAWVRKPVKATRKK